MLCLLLATANSRSEGPREVRHLKDGKDAPGDAMLHIPP